MDTDPADHKTLIDKYVANRKAAPDHFPSKNHPEFWKQYDDVLNAIHAAGLFRDADSAAARVIDR